MFRQILCVPIALLICCLFSACSGEPDQAGLPTGPIAYALPDGTLMPHAPLCSSPPAFVAGCTTAASCDDYNPCTSDACVSGQCSYRVSEVGASCGLASACDGEGCCSDR